MTRKSGINQVQVKQDARQGVLCLHVSPVILHARAWLAYHLARGRSGPPE